MSYAKLWLRREELTEPKPSFSGLVHWRISLACVDASEGEEEEVKYPFDPPIAVCKLDVIFESMVSCINAKNTTDNLTCPECERRWIQWSHDAEYTS